MKLVIFLALMCTTYLFSAQNIVEWRYDRTGIYSKESGLLKSWLSNGPELLWHFDELGLGYTTVSIANDKLFVTGYTDGEGYLYVLGLDGKLQHKVKYGREFDNSYPGARSTVIPNAGKLYIVSGMAELFCYDMQSLKLLWKKSYVKDFGAENTRHGWHGPPLIVGEKLIIAPGGKTHNVVALNKITGATIWSSEGAGDRSGYGVPIYIGNQQVQQVAVMMSSNVVGVDISNGKLLWSHPLRIRSGEHPNAPIYSNNMLLYTSGNSEGSTMLRLTNGGRSVEKIWEKAELESRHGGVVKIGNYAYMGGDPSRNRFWYCVDWNTGEIKYKDNSIAVGAVIANDGMLYCYSERGEMALVKATPQKFDIVSKFRIILGTEQHWSHPVIYRGVLYVRRGNTLMAYKIK
jgi:outer membrane protein assembly factor BamB